MDTNPADLILCARRIYPTVKRPARADAIAVAAGKIAAIGTRRSILRHRRRGTRVVDLGDGAITPGLVDCHTHLFYWALYRARVIDVSACRSLAAALETIRTKARRRHFGRWIVASGFDYNTWPEGIPCAGDLDAILPDRPAVVRSRDGHTAWLNSAALKRAGIDSNWQDPPGGRTLRDAHGRPTGIVQEATVDHLPDPVRDFATRTDAAARRAVDRALDDAFAAARALGIVGVHTMDDAPSLAHLQRLHGERRLGLRVVHAIPLSNLDHALALGLRSGLGDDRLRIGAVKIFADGALGSQTAWMFRPYPGSAGHCGVPVIAGAALRDVVRRAAAGGLAAWIHAIGDRAVHDAIRAIGAARRVEPAPLGHRIEHAQCVRAADIRAMAALGIVASVQPCHIPGDIRTAQRHWPRASRRAYPLRSLLDAGVTLAMGSDVPIESIDPRRSLFGAVVRTEPGGYPAGGWYPRQRLTVAEVLDGFTRGAAAAAPTAASAPPGTITIGAPADLTLWREDPLRVKPDRLLDVEIGGCVLDGELHLNRN